MMTVPRRPLPARYEPGEVTPLSSDLQQDDADMRWRPLADAAAFQVDGAPDNVQRYVADIDRDAVL